MVDSICGIYLGILGKFLNSKEPDRRYRIAYAYSNDGLNWNRNSKYIVETKSETECQALPTVFTYKGLYHMYFCYRDVDFRSNPQNSYKLGYAYSYDGLSWTRDDINAGISTTEFSWDSEMMCYPNVFESAGNYYTL